MTQTLEQTQTSTFTPGEFRHRFSIEEFEALSFRGAFAGQRVELIRGDIHFMAAMGTPHFLAVRIFNQELVTKLGQGAAISCQLPVNLVGHSQPEPDFTVVKVEKAAPRIPSAEDIATVIEISDSTLRYDRTEKLTLYASNHIPEYWIVDVARVTLEIYREPEGSEYLFKHVLKKGQSASLLEFPDTLLEWWGFDAQE